MVTVIIALALCLIEITVIIVASPMTKPSLILGFLPEDVALAAKNHPEPPKSKQIILQMKAVCNMKAIVNNESLAEILMHDPLSSGSWGSLEFLYTMLYPEISVEPEDFDRCPVEE